MLILGIDPGPTSSGWALIAPARGNRARFIDAGEVGSSFREITEADLFHEDLDDGGRVALLATAIETPEGYVHEHKRGKALLETARVAERWATLAWSESDGEGSGERRPPIALSCAKVRRALCGNGSASDAVVARTLKLLVEGMPKKSNSHKRDALAVAVVASWAIREFRVSAAGAKGAGR